jgi:hypothetical protein
LCRTQMIEKNERAHHLPIRAGQNAPHDKAAEITLVRPNHLDDLHDLPDFSDGRPPSTP